MPTSQFSDRYEHPRNAMASLKVVAAMASKDALLLNMLMATEMLSRMSINVMRAYGILSGVLRIVRDR